jgi:5-methylcytosine-specific restriction endonuclease McrA
MTDAKLKSKAIAALRKVWRHSDMRSEAIAKAKDPSTPRHLICAACGASTHEKLSAVDHIIPVVGPEGFVSWDLFYERLMSPSSNLQILCESCHKGKSKEETVRRREFKKANKPPKPPKVPKPRKAKAAKGRKARVPVDPADLF